MKLTPPEDLSDEALLEWHRVTAELDELGLLKDTDRAVLTLYTRTWQVWHAAARHVAVVGPVVTWEHNGLRGLSLEYKAMKDMARLLNQFLSQLGLTAKARGELKQTGEVTEDKQPKRLEY